MEPNVPASEYFALLWPQAALLLPIVVFFVLVPRRFRPQLPPQHVRSAPWTGATVWAILIILNIHVVLANQIPWVGGLDIPRKQLSSAAAFFILELLAVGLILAPARPYLSLPNIRRTLTNIAIGIIAWSLLTPSVLNVNELSQWILQSGGVAPNEHALITALRSNRKDVVLWLLVTLEAALLAPIREELFFRGVLQPWAVLRPWGGDLMFALAAIVGFVQMGNAPITVAVQPIVFVALMICGLRWFELFLTHRTKPMPQWWLCLFPPLANGTAITGVKFRRGIVGVAVFFGMFHAAIWPDPIALSFLGIGLGWLAWRTQSLTAPIVCHMLFNALSLGQIRLEALLK